MWHQCLDGRILVCAARMYVRVHVGEGVIPNGTSYFYWSKQLCLSSFYNISSSSNWHLPSSYYISRVGFPSLSFIRSRQQTTAKNDVPQPTNIRELFSKKLNSTGTTRWLGRILSLFLRQREKIHPLHFPPMLLSVQNQRHTLLHRNK